jgi:hypothetical protein
MAALVRVLLGAIVRGLVAGLAMDLRVLRNTGDIPE